MEGGELVQGSEIGRDIAFRIRDHRAALAEDQVAGEDRAIVRKQKREVIGAVPGRVERCDVEVAGAHDVAVAEVGMAPHGSTMLLRESLREGQVVGV